MPKQIGFNVTFATWLETGHDLPELCVQGRFGEFACLNVSAEAAKLAALTLSPIIDDQFCHDIGERQLDRAHRAIRHDKRALLDPLGLWQWRWPVEPRRLDH